MVKEEIIKALKKITKEDYVFLDVPEREEFGDYSSNIAMQTAKGSQNPHQYAQEITDELTKDKKLSTVVEKIEVAGPGFINFWIKKDILINNLIQINSEQDNYGRGKIGSERIIFEFGQPNTHKLPHIGHLFSYIYGDAMSRILEAVGYTIRRANYHGDVGLHVAKCLWAYQKKNPIVPKMLSEKVKLLQECYQEGSAAYEKEKRAKKEIETLNRAIYAQDAKLSPLWLETRSWSVRYYKEFEEKLGIAYDRSYFESEVYKDAVNIVNDNTPQTFKKSQGAVIFPGSEYSLHDRVFINNSGDPTYEAKDLALAKLKIKEWPADKLIVTTASEQNDYFKVVIKALETIDPSFKGKFIHIGFGMVSLKSGKMSSRTGEFIGAIELVNQVIGEIDKILVKRKDISDSEKGSIAQMVGVGAVKYSFLKNNPLQDTKFDIKESVSIDGNSGPYLQYTFARCKSVLGKSSKGVKPKSSKEEKLNPEETSLLRSIYHFPEAVSKAAKDYTPNTICEYLYLLAQKYNSFYNKHKIIGSENESLRLLLTRSSSQVIKNGLTLLGIATPDRM